MQKRNGVVSKQKFVPNLRLCSAHVSDNRSTYVWEACYQYLVYSILSDQRADLAMTRTLPAARTR